MEITIKWSMCRTCSKKGSSLHSLFESNAHNQLAFHAGIVVEPDDGLPDQICSDCLERLEEVDRFLGECKRSDEHLRKLVQKTMSSAAPFHTLNSKDLSAGQRKRARKQKISERLNEEKPLVVKTEKNPIKVKETQTKTLEFIPIMKSQSEEEAGNFVFHLNVYADNEKSAFQEDYTISDLEKEIIEDNDLETSSQEGTVITENPEETSEESQKSEPALDYEVDLGVACQPDKYKCKICSNTYPRLRLLNVHMLLHGKEKLHECEVCQKSFRAACNLKTHMRTHTGEKPYKCSYCSRRFADCSTHRKHERMHTNERPYVCNVCGKSFSLSTSRKAHYLLHTSEKKHKCDTCNKAFRLKHQLKAHQKSHTHLLGVSLANECSNLVE
ncbi:zinc finger protein 724 [Drosophila ficusphila]|uniref:zinc finger protein 724 n=1 Tax=Drosophila ficusphila TaxID=30025 RepID=UPI0007E862A7|nr:zinc finger protein 724 [Drosophila ficusphila]